MTVIARRSLFGVLSGAALAPLAASAPVVEQAQPQRVICGQPTPDLRGRAFCVLANNHTGDHLPARRTK